MHLFSKLFMKYSYIFMIISRQQQRQLPIFYPKHTISNLKGQLQTSVLDNTGFRDRQEFKKKIIKRLSCHNISDASNGQNQQNQSQQFSSKLLDHIFTQIKHNQKVAINQKADRTIIHAMAQKNNQKNLQDDKDLNRQNNLQIKSINNLIKPKTQGASRNKTANVPFQNKKLMTLRKGKSYTLYTQEVQLQITEPSNDAKILPWEYYNNHILTLPGATQQIDDETVQQHYLKSHNLKHKDSKPFTKYNTLAFALPEQRKPPIKRFSSIDVTHPEKNKTTTTNYKQIFSAYCVKERLKKQPIRHRGKHDNVRRNLTEMKMDIQSIQLDKSEDPNHRSIKIEDFFQCAIPKNIFPRKPAINYMHKPPQSFHKNQSESLANSFIVGGRKI